MSTVKTFYGRHHDLVDPYTRTRFKVPMHNDPETTTEDQQTTLDDVWEPAYPNSYPIAAGLDELKYSQLSISQMQSSSQNSDISN